MASITLSWADFWALFKRADLQERKETYAQLDMEHFIRGLSSKHQIEVLKNAPDSVIQQVKAHLSREAQIALYRAPQEGVLRFLRE